MEEQKIHDKDVKVYKRIYSSWNSKDDESANMKVTIPHELTRTPIVYPMRVSIIVEGLGDDLILDGYDSAVEAARYLAFGKYPKVHKFVFPQEGSAENLDDKILSKKVVSIVGFTPDEQLKFTMEYFECVDK